MEDNDNECKVAVDSAVEDLVTHVAEQQDASRSLPGKLEKASVPSEAPKPAKRVPQVPEKKRFDVDVTAQAADKLFRFSKEGYFHPQATQTPYIKRILTDPYFKPVPKPALRWRGLPSA